MTTAISHLFFLASMIVFVCLGTISSIVQAHNKVVVIPMAGDDVVQTIKPLRPLAATAPADSDYTINSLTVVDNVTQLEWERNIYPYTSDWEQAFDQCLELNLDGKTDWRLPTINELLSIVDYGAVTPPAINGVAFALPSTIPRDAIFWSVSQVASIPDAAWVVNFDDGSTDSTLSKVNSLYYRCVR